MKRLLLTHASSDRVIDTDSVASGLLQSRNTPDPETDLSPAQIVFGRSLRDLLPVTPETPVFDSPNIQPVWRDTWACQEQAMRLRFARQTDALGKHARSLATLSPGTTVLIQNQAGQHAKRWDRTGSIVEVKPNDQYVVRVHGSGRVTLRNRRFLRPITGLLPFERQVVGRGGTTGGSNRTRTHRRGRRCQRRGRRPEPTDASQRRQGRCR